MADVLPENRPLHLLEFGLLWPAEAFIAAKLERLGAQGIKITVASPPTAVKSAPRQVDVLGVVVSDVRVLSVPARLSGLWSLIVLLVGRPRRALAVFTAAGLPNAAGEPVLRRERWARRLAYARIARRRPDVIKFEWESAAVDYCSLIDALGVPAVMSCRGRPLAHVLRPSRRRIAQGLASVFDRVAAAHCVSETVAREAIELGLDPGKVRVIRGAVDSAFFCPPPAREPDDRLRVVSVGHLRWLKGHEYSVLTVAELARNGVPAVLKIIGGDPHPAVGDLSERGRIAYISDYLNVGDRVDLLGFLRADQIRNQLQQADVLLHASLTEGLPNAVLEAMACGLPVVATDVGGTREAVRHGVDGFLVPPRDPAAAARALATLWVDRGLRRRMGEAGRARVRAHFTPEHQTEGWVRLYADVAYRSTDEVAG